MLDYVTFYLPTIKAHFCKLSLFNSDAFRRLSTPFSGSSLLFFFATHQNDTSTYWS